MKGPTLVIVFKQTVPLGVSRDDLVLALQKYIDEHLNPAWGCSARLVVADRVGEDDWSLIFADTSDQAQALGYHDLSRAAPRGFVFVKTSQAAGEPVSVTASHELAELLLDPACNLAAYTPRDRWVAARLRPGSRKRHPRQ